MAVRGAEGREAGPSAGVLDAIRAAFPWLRHVFADLPSPKRSFGFARAGGGHAGSKLRGALARIGAWTLEIVRRSQAATGFTALPRRWVVERTFAWLNRDRRLAKDLEATSASAEARLYIASVQFITWRLARA